MEQNEVTLSEYWRIIRKRKLTLFSVFVIVVASTFIFTKMQTPIYQAVMELKIEKQQPVVTTSNDQIISIEMPWEDINLATEIRLIKSLPIMKKVVERMEVLPAEAEEREKALHNLSLGYQGRVDVSQIENTNIISVRVFSNDPENAALIATALADVYIVENVEGRKRQSRALIKYIEQQLKEYQNQIVSQEEKLQSFKQNEKVFEVTTDIKESLNRLTIEGTFEFESKMLRLDTELGELNKLIVQRKNKKIYSVLTEGAVADNFIFVGLKRRLLELEFERFLLLIDYTEKHPSVLSQDKVISDVKNKIVNMIKQYSNIPITLDLETDLALMVKRLFLETRREVLYRIINRFYEEAGSLSSNQVEYLGIKRSIERLINSYDSLVKQRDEVKLNMAQIIDDVVTIASPPNPQRSPIKPNLNLNLMMSFAVGLMLGILICFVQESMDASIGTMSDLEKELDLTVLGLVPHMKKEDLFYDREEYSTTKDRKLMLQKARLVTIMDPKSWPAESVKMIRTNLLRLMNAQEAKVVLFTSSDKQEGKSTIVTNMALSMAQLGKKVVIVGSNLRRPTVYKIFGLDREPGLSDILMGNVSWKEVINNSTDILTGGLDIDKLLQIPGVDNLKVITSGRPVDNVSEILNSQAFDNLLVELKNHFDIIIVDCSPIMAVPDAITLCDKVDGVVLVYKVGHTSKDVLRVAKSNLVNAKANMLGVVLNDIKTEAQVGSSAYYYRYYAEASEKDERRAAKTAAHEKKIKKSSQNDLSNV